MAVGRRPAHDAGPGPALSAADTGRVRAVLALGGVPFGELDDGVQQVWLKLLEQQSRPDRAPVRNPAAWAAVVATRVAADWHRGRTRDAGLRERLAARWSRPVAEHPEDARLLALAVAKGLEELPDRQRQVVVLRYYADLPVKDIAEALNIPEGTVKSRLHGAAAVLRTRLQGAVGEGEGEGEGEGGEVR